MKPFTERNPVTVGVVGLAVTAATVIAAVQYRQLPFMDANTEYTAYFSEAGGLSPGAEVQVSGNAMGTVSDVALVDQHVVVRFELDNDVRLGEQTEAAIKTKSLLGARLLEITPRGGEPLSGPIPLDKTTPPYQLSDAMGELSSTVEQLDTGQLSESLTTLAQTFADTPADLQAAVHGLARFSESLNKRDDELRNMLLSADRATKVLADRSDQVVTLINASNALLAQLRSESAAVDQVSGNLSALSKQMSGFVADNRAQLRPSLDKLNGVLAIVANRKDRLQDAIKRLNRFSMSLGEALSSGPFFNAYIANLLPGQFVQPFIDAAFSDLGLDPNTMLPSELSDPQTGQAATPALPVPYPRTGQGGEPRLNLPDAITGNPGDPRYPYREPLPAPAPGGPPPGPPASASQDVPATGGEETP